MINLKKYNVGDKIEKNKLYKIDNTQIISFSELHSDNSEKETVNLQYTLKDDQYGIYAHEYRSPNINKEGAKTTDILACIVDNSQKHINTYVIDVKHNIMAFSDNLYNENVLMTVIKNIRDFIAQIHSELLHKNSFILYLLDDKYKEDEKIGIATKEFDANKLIEAANAISSIINEENDIVPIIIQCKVKNQLLSYSSSIIQIKDFANKKVTINDKTYDLNVYLLESDGDHEWSTTIKLYA